jgi:hypothetical protein
MAPTGPKKQVDLVSRRRVARATSQSASPRPARNVAECPQCGFEMENRCMARCANCGFYMPCGSEPDF